MTVNRWRGAALVAAVAAVIGTAPATSVAQEFPTKPVRLIVPYPPGGVMDVTARAFATPMADILKQQVVVENRPGAGGNIGTDLAARAEPDGHTVLIFADTNVIAPALYRKLNHDPVKDFAPVTLLVTGSHVLVAHPSVPVTDVKSLIEHAKRNPGTLSYATPGNGTAQHLGGEMFKSAAGGLQIAHVPYKGGGQAIVDVVGGQVPLAMLGMAPALPHIKAGRLKALAVTGKTRVPILPDVPTLDESGLTGFETVQWYGPSVPAGTPAAVIARLHEAFVAASKAPSVERSMKDIGLTISTSPTPADFGAYIAREVARWPAIVKAAGARVD